MENVKETMQQEIARLREENAKLKAAKTSSLSFKVSEKGAVSICGLQRFPVTLYKSQWERVVEQVPQLVAFMAENEALLKTKE